MGEDPPLRNREIFPSKFSESFPGRHSIVTQHHNPGFLDAHLLLQEMKLSPGEEWTFSGEGWRFLSTRLGQGYWLAADPKPIEPGDAIMLSPLGRGILRASQLTGLTFVYFHFQPDRLTDLLSPVERHYLESSETQVRLALKLIAANDPWARDFSSLAQRATCQNSLASRSAILQLVAAAVGIEANSQPEMPVRLPGAKDRFLQLLGQMSESEFINCTVGQVARQSRCSARHLSRLFHEAFGVSFSARQTELRMQRAVQLLKDTDLKISQVARECGYGHLGLFNATFKRRWKQTPSESRQSQRTSTNLQAAS